MKKFLAILLAMMLVMVSVAAMASSPTAGDADQYVQEKVPSIKEDVDYAEVTEAEVTKTAAIDVPFSKKINVLDYNGTGKTPEQFLKFTVGTSSIDGNSTFISNGGTIPAITIVGADENESPIVKIAAGGTTADLKIKIPEYTAVGVYTYPVTETNMTSDEEDAEETTIAGVTNGTELEVKVTVVRNTETEKLYVGGIAIRQGAEKTKTDKFENQFASGSLQVTKMIEGNMGDRSKAFPIVVTFKSQKTVKNDITYKVNGGTPTTITPDEWSEGQKSVTVNLAYKESAVFDNIPYDVTYTVTEPDITERSAVDVADASKPNAYFVSGEKDEAQSITAAAMTPETIINTKTVNPDTGITLETLPYVLMMALAMMGLVALKLRKREEY